MGSTALIQHLDTLIKLHRSLLKLANQKTEAIKTNNIDVLEKLMNEEQKHIKAITQIENERLKEVALLMDHQDHTTPSLMDVIAQSEDGQSDLLKKQREQLLELTQQLKDANHLNQQLIYSSLQYVNLTLDMLRPQEANYNYNKPANNGGQHMKRSLFDSQA
ncbi:flagellar protein FlgN [Bacillus testis]|uniref:flagellar protein FlgN n=1 Tax=Bacillus testis TaxID=1622072 RepID=UPI00067EAE71|nr:flagellar protein FlgN [Bacillus testis]